MLGSVATPAFIAVITYLVQAWSKAQPAKQRKARPAAVALGERPEFDPSGGVPSSGRDPPPSSRRGPPTRVSSSSQGRRTPRSGGQAAVATTQHVVHPTKGQQAHGSSTPRPQRCSAKGKRTPPEKPAAASHPEVRGTSVEERYADLCAQYVPALHCSATNGWCPVLFHVMPDVPVPAAV